MKPGPLVDLPDDEYRAHWLAFREQTDWSSHQDVTSQRITFVGPDALYRRNKGSFLDRLERQVHCRPYAGHIRRARRTGAWIPEEKLTDVSLFPGENYAQLLAPQSPRLTDLMRSRLHDVATWFHHAPVPVKR